jgi:DNA polymerase-1
VIAQARVDGYVTTLGGRRRQLADIDSAQWQLAYKAERQAVNSLVQGSAADVVRRAMLGCRRVVPPSVARICLQVHDEIIWVRSPEFDDDWFDMVKDVCENGTFDLDVPLVFEAKIAQSWAEKA